MAAGAVSVVKVDPACLSGVVLRTDHVMLDAIMPFDCHDATADANGWSLAG